MTYRPSDLETETWMRGGCHVHAVAAVTMHGGHYAVAYGPDEGDDYEAGNVIHVWSVHETPGGLVARDLNGDVPAVPEAMRAALERVFFTEHLFLRGEAWIDLQATRQEIEDMSGDDDRRPLMAITEADLREASLLPSVTLPPGENPAISGDDIEP